MDMAPILDQMDEVLEHLFGMDFETMELPASITVARLIHIRLQETLLNRPKTLDAILAKLVVTVGDDTYAEHQERIDAMAIRFADAILYSLDGFTKRFGEYEARLMVCSSEIEFLL